MLGNIPKRKLPDKYPDDSSKIQSCITIDVERTIILELVEKYVDESMYLHLKPNSENKHQFCSSSRIPRRAPKYFWFAPIFLDNSIMWQMFKLFAKWIQLSRWTYIYRKHGILDCVFQIGLPSLSATHKTQSIKQNLIGAREVLASLFKIRKNIFTWVSIKNKRHKNKSVVQEYSKSGQY